MDDDGWKGNFIAATNSNLLKTPLGMNQMVLRRCQLRNTKWIIGACVYTGYETKIMLNSQKIVYKRSNVDRIVDQMLYMLFACEIILIGTCGTMYHFWLSDNRTSSFYNGWEFYNDSEFMDAFGNTISFLILLETIIPISLYVSMELVKFGQAYLIREDPRMYHKETDTPAQARTSNLNEELGQIDYVFSDKTGTLTQNKMEFLRCYVAKTKFSSTGYGPGETKNDLDIDQHPEYWKPSKPRSGIPAIPRSTNPEPQFDAEDPDKGNPNWPYPQGYIHADYRMVYHNEQEGCQGNINEFLTLLVTCHSAIPEVKNGENVYQSPSPDDLALVYHARNHQYLLEATQPRNHKFQDLNIDLKSIFVNIMGVQYEFKVLAFIEFSSKRKRMSVIVRDPRDGKLKLYIKGADNIIEERLRADSKRESWEQVDKYLTRFSREGLRTLCCAYRVLDERELYAWLQRWLEAKASMGNRKALMENAAAEIERELILVACTAIEDKLQDGVPETIASLQEGNIDVWMLTGDKVETAKNIAITCRLISDEMTDNKLIEFDPSKEEEAHVAQGLRAEAEKLRNANKGRHTPLKKAIVLSGRALSQVFPPRKIDDNGNEIQPSSEEIALEKELQIELLSLCKMCQAIVCCRISPKQKAQIVQLVKTNEKGSITLAIGDGANDVAMIKSAHVGIGISGLEGLQAVMAADYAIAQFRFLKNLLFVHGAWSYRKISIVILYSFYKNVALAMTQFWFGVYSGWSGQPYFDPWAGSCFNAIFTAIPILIASILNKDYSYDTAMEYSFLYKDGQDGHSFNIPLFLGYFFEGLLHSLVLFFICTFGMPDVASKDGGPTDLWMVSSTMYTACVLVVSAKVALLTTTWNRLAKIFLFGSILSWFLFIYICSVTWNITPNIFGVAQQLFGSSTYWLVVWVSFVFCVVPDVAVEYYRIAYCPSRVDLARSLQSWEKRRDEKAAKGVTS